MLCISFFIIATGSLPAQDIKQYNSLEELWLDLKTHNYIIKNAAIQEKIASLTYTSSIGNAINPRIPVNLNFTDYTKLQRNLIPGEFFGAEPGTFKQIQFGLQYATLATIQPQFDILNPGSLSQIKYAEINQKYIKNQQLLLERDVYEKVNATYYNILSLRSQYEILKKNTAVAEQILSIVQSKYDEGIIRKQDVNDARSNMIIIKDNQEQTAKNIEIQEQILSLFFENQIKPEIKENLVQNTLSNVPESISSTLTLQGILLQSALLRQEIKGLQYQYLPTLSFVSSFNWQHLSNDFFLASDATSFTYNNIGLRLSWEFPTVQRISNIKNKQYQLQTLSLNEQHATQESLTESRQLKTELEKAISQYDNYTALQSLKEDSYQKYLLQYKENVLPLDRLLTAQNDLLTIQLKTVTSLANKAFITGRIKILNQY